jgi:hypothetical protein
MFGTNDGEVPPIQRGDGMDPKPLSEGHDGGIDGPKRKVVISAYEFRNPHPIAGNDRLREKISGSEVAKEAHLRLPAQACFDEIGDFGDDQLRHQQRTWVRF